MCNSNQAQFNDSKASNIVVDGKDFSADFSAALLCQSNVEICGNCDRSIMGFMIESRPWFEPTSETPIRGTAGHAGQRAAAAVGMVVMAPTPIAQEEGTVQAVPSVSTLPDKMKQYCDDYIAVLSHLFSQDQTLPSSSSRKHRKSLHGQGEEEQSREEPSAATMRPAHPQANCFSRQQTSLFFIAPKASTSDESLMGGGCRGGGGSSGGSSRGTDSRSQSSAAAADADPRERLVLPYQQERWIERYHDLLAFCHQHGHVNVPYVCNENPSLGQWVKRQRHQYKLRKQGLHANLNESRIQALNMLGFIWDSHGASWEEKYKEIKAFYQIHGHTNVPYIYQGTSQLSNWIKRQRRQYRLFEAEKTSTMDRVRIARLEAIGFVWDYYGNNHGNLH